MSDVTFSNAVNAYRRADSGESVRSMEKNSMGTPHLPGASERDNSTSFSDLVSNSLKQASVTGYQSEEVSTRAIANEADLHELVTTVANAELTLNTVVAIRDRTISAYQEIVKMPI